MARKHYSMDEVIRQLSKKNDVKINKVFGKPWNGEIEVLKNKVRNSKFELVDNPKKKYDLGNGSWGKIDFLVNHCNFILSYVNAF